MIALSPIAIARSARKEPIDGGWDAIPTRIELDPARFTADSTAGLGDFSHIEVVYFFDRVADADVQTGARRPRGREDWPLIVILAQRGKVWPNRLGVTICKLLSVNGLTLSVQGLDAIDGTPVIDIKPVTKGFLPRRFSRTGLVRRDHADLLVAHARASRVSLTTASAIFTRRRKSRMRARSALASFV